MMSTTSQLFDALAGDLRIYVARRVRDPVVTDDLVQEVFARVHARLDEVRDRDRIVPWVYRIARSVVIDHVRRARPTASLEHEPAAPETPDDDANATVASWLPGMVEALPEPYREAMRLSELMELSQAEVARRLGLSASGARTRVQRGRRLLAAQLRACCTFELDRSGGVVDWHRNASGCCPWDADPAAPAAGSGLR